MTRYYTRWKRTVGVMLVAGCLAIPAGAALAQDADGFTGLIPGQSLSDQELGSFYGKGVTTSTASSSTISGNFSAPRELPFLVQHARSLASGARAAGGMTLSAKNAARDALGTVTLPRHISLESNVEISVVRAAP